MLLNRWTFLLPALAIFSNGAVLEPARAEVVVQQSESSRPSAAVFPANRVVRRTAAAPFSVMSAPRSHVECRSIGCGRYILVGISF